MKKFITTLILSLLITPFALAGLSADSSSDDVLDALYDVGKDLKSFTADVKMAEYDNFAQSTSTRIGQVWYQVPEGGQPRMRITFTKRIKDEVVQSEMLEYKLENGWLTDRNYTLKKEARRQLLRPGEKVNLLKLGEGPFPLPIGQKREDVLKQFDVKKVAPEKTDPANTVHLTLIPKPGTQFERKFVSIDVWVNMQSNMPQRIKTADRNDDTRTTDFDKILVNPTLNDEHFKLSEINDKDWTRSDKEYRD
jgi:outer membrane lipoprotein-sorting protein